MRPIARVFKSLHTQIRFKMVEAKVEDKIGYIYLNSPSDFNALSQPMRAAISEAVRSHEASQDVKVILFLSKVQKAFCAGANIKEFQGKTSKDF
jgi:enoyl-CoA hydratase/carnithine racemase